MKCPHCSIGIHETIQRFSQLDTGGFEVWVIRYQRCPECNKPILKLHGATLGPGGSAVAPILFPQFLAYPRSASARPLPPEVPDPYKQDFDEAVAVLPLSSKASAALSRRNLQAVLHNVAGAKAKDLFDQIEEMIASGKLPSHIADDLHAVRNIGNFAAHEIKSKVTGAIVDVEAGEAEWNLDVLESLFDFYFVEPAKAAKRKAELNKKLKEAGKPLIP